MVAMTASTSPFQAVIFDMDGTLTDSEEAWDVVRRGLADADGVPWPPEATTAMMGMSTQEWSSYLAETVGLPGSAEDSARRTIGAMRELYLSGRVELLPGARDAVRRMAALGPVGIASSSPVVLIEAGIAELDVADEVTAFVSTEQVGRGKPAPDGYLRCAELLGVEAARCLAVEDSSNGIRSALAAGMHVVCVPPAFHRPADDLLARCTVLDSLDELTADLLHRIA